MSKSLLFWGDTQSGKSTLLTTGIFSDDVKQLIDIGKSTESLVKGGVFNARRALEENRPMESTSGTMDIDLSLQSPDTDPVLVRDIRGGAARDMSFINLVDEASGVLFVVEWEGPTFQDQMATIARALDVVRTKTKLFGLAITKCERALLKDDPVWMSRGDDQWWEHYSCWNQHKDIMHAMGERIWVTSAYGYHDRRPAALLGEFGEWFPFRTQPINVGRPLAWFIREFVA